MRKLEKVATVMEYSIFRSDDRVDIRNGSRHVILWGDSTVTRGDVRLDLAQNMTQDQAIKYLRGG